MNKRLFKERIRGSLAIVLAFALILTNMNTIAFAAEPQGTESDKKIITKIGEPDSSVLSQTLAVGAEESDIQFPESLTATVTKEQETETPAEPETEKETVPETEQSSEEKTPEEVTEEPAETEEKSSETEQTESTEPEEKSSETEPTEATGTEEKSSETEHKAIETESAEATEITETTETEKSVAEQLFGWLAPMTVYAAERNEKEESIAVTWKLDESASTSAAFDASKAGNTYVYLPVIPGEYTVAEGVELPKIIVTIAASDTAFSKSEVVDGVTVTVTADEGVFPEGSTLNVKKVEEPSVVDAFESAVEEKQPENSEDAIVQEIRTEMENLAVQGLDELGVGNQNEQELKVFDITITDKDGAEVQPDTSKGKTTVSFTGIDTDSNTDDIQVYHANEDMKDIQALETNADVDAGYAEVVAEHFSYYCLSTLATGTQLEVKELTSSDAGAQLSSGIYYINSDLTLNEDKSHYNGLKIAENATAYIYIPEGTTLTVYGQDGTNATNGGDATEPSFTFFNYTQKGIKYRTVDAVTEGTAGTGGSGATGGGAAIYVPASAKLVLLGGGTLKATGGKGGNAGAGGLGSASQYYIVTWYAPKSSSVSGISTYKSKSSWADSTASGTCTYSKSYGFYDTVGMAGGAGGAGGGGAAGGGAAVGTNGASGSNGLAGAVNAKASAVTTATGSTNIISADTTSANIYVSGISTDCIGGAGGNTVSTQSSASNETKNLSGMYAKRNGSSTSIYPSGDGTDTLYITYGQNGGSGGAGGKGAGIGNGGAGGAGGTGGDSGMVNLASLGQTACGTASSGKTGATGTDSTDSTKDLDSSKYPYNTITFTNAKSNATQNYYITKQTQITVPDYEVEDGKYFVGWKVTTPATVLPSSFGEQTCGLETAGTVYQAGDTITVTGVYGNVVLEAVVITHTHDWNYEVDSTDKNKIIAYCSETENKEYCAYQKENALTLTLSATNAIYSGKAYTGASMKDDITSVTKETANIEYYQVDTENTTDGGTKLSSAPTDAGYYYASVALGGATVKAAFTIEKKSIKDAVISLTPGDVLHTGTEVTQTVGSVTLDGVTLTASAYEVADSSTFKATDFGIYTITVNGVGNYKDSASVKWKIKDENPPTGEITIEKNNWKSFLSDATFGIFFKATQTVTINASDTGSGVDKVYYYNSNKILSLDEVKALADSKWKLINNGGSYDIDPENQYVVYAKITDKSGNVTYISSEGFVIDKTAPTITGVKDQGAYCEAVTFTATDAYLKTVTVDGTAVTLSADGSYTIKADDKAHTIVAEDKAGNTTTVHVTVYNGHSWKAPVFTWSADYSSAKATFTCAHDDSHTETKDCTVKKETTKQASGTQKGEITYTATVTFEGKTYEDTKTQETVIAGSEEIGTNGGKITTEIIVSDDMPQTEIKNLTVETAKALLTADELAQVETGAEITIYLEANSLTEDAVSASDKTYVEGKLDNIMEQLMQSEGLTSKKQVSTGIQYIDLSLYKRIGNGIATKLKSTGQNELEITVEIPANLKSDNSKRTYYIIRVHETDAGTEVDILPTTKSGDELTFKTDRFSTYAIAYAEPNSYVMPAKVTLNPTQATLTSKGATTQLTATVEPSNATNKNVTWASSDTSVATVDANGLVTAVANGTATITVTTEEGGLTATATITVNISSGGGDTPTPNPSEEKKPTSISLNKTKDTLTSKGSTSQLIATVKPDDAANKNVTWKSSDTSVATVDANGLVTAVANGTVTITATTVEGGLTATATITVKISSGDNGNSDNNNNNNDNNNNNNSSDNNGNNSNNDSSAVVPDSQKDSQNVTSPKTGDDSNMALWTTLLIASVAGLAALFGRRKKRS